MTRVLYLSNILQLVIDRLNQTALAQPQLVAQHHQPISHLPSQLGNQRDIEVTVQLSAQSLTDIAAVAEDFAMQTLEQFRHRFAVISIARRQAHIEQFAAFVNHQVQLEAKEPAHRSPPPGRQAREDFVRMNAAYMADSQAGRIDKADTGARAETLSQISTQRHQGRRHPLDEALVAESRWGTQSTI